MAASMMNAPAVHSATDGHSTSSQAESTPAHAVGSQFVQQFYTVLHSSPKYLHRFYTDASTFTHYDGGVEGGPPSAVNAFTVSKQKNIHERVMMLGFEEAITEIWSVDSQYSMGDGVIVQVTGSLQCKNKPRRSFVQTFFLAVQEKGYFVLNDIFRYVPGTKPALGYADTNGYASPEYDDLGLPVHANGLRNAYAAMQHPHGPLLGHGPNPPAHPALHAPHAAPPLQHAAPAAPHAGLPAQHTQQIPPPLLAPVPPPPPAPAATPRPETPPPQPPQAPPAPPAQPAPLPAPPVPQAPAPTPQAASASQQKDALPEAEAGAVAADDPAAPPQPPADLERQAPPAVEAPAPPRTFAQLFRGEGGSGPAPAVPRPPPPASPVPRPAPAPAGAGGTAAPSPASPAPAAPDAPSPANGGFQEGPAPGPVANGHAVEGGYWPEEAPVTSVFVRDLPPEITAEKLEEAFARFGAVRGGVRGVALKLQKGKDSYAFVEFEEAAAMHAAIEGSVLIDGQKVSVVEKRPQFIRGRGRAMPRGGPGRGGWGRGDREPGRRGRGRFPPGGGGPPHMDRGPPSNPGGPGGFQLERSGPSGPMGEGPGGRGPGPEGGRGGRGGRGPASEGRGRGEGRGGRGGGEGRGMGMGPREPPRSALVVNRV